VKKASDTSRGLGPGIFCHATKDFCAMIGTRTVRATITPF
jgi:hypothetical protein